MLCLKKNSCNMTLEMIFFRGCQRCKPIFLVNKTLFFFCKGKHVFLHSTFIEISKCHVNCKILLKTCFSDITIMVYFVEIHDKICWHVPNVQKCIEKRIDFGSLMRIVYLLVRQLPCIAKVQKSYALCKIIKPERLVQKCFKTSICRSCTRIEVWTLEALL